METPEIHQKSAETSLEHHLFLDDLEVSITTKCCSKPLTYPTKLGELLPFIS
jgi:hypothetical protein